MVTRRSSLLFISVISVVMSFTRSLNFNVSLFCCHFYHRYDHYHSRNLSTLQDERLSKRFPVTNVSRKLTPFYMPSNILISSHLILILWRTRLRFSSLARDLFRASICYLLRSAQLHFFLLFSLLNIGYILVLTNPLPCHTARLFKFTPIISRFVAHCGDFKFSSFCTGVRI